MTTRALYYTSCAIFGANVGFAIGLFVTGELASAAVNGAAAVLMVATGCLKWKPRVSNSPFPAPETPATGPFAPPAPDHESENDRQGRCNVPAARCKATENPVSNPQTGGNA